MTRRENDFFIGWSADTPRADRRFFLKAGLGLTALAGIGGVALAASQNPPGPGTWDQGAIREWRGIVTATPYAMLRTTDIDGTPRTALLSCLGKCGVAAEIGASEGESVVVTGSLIQRGNHSMIAVAETTDWIRSDSAAAAQTLRFPAIEPVSEVSLNGEILDSKCWFGAMRPSEGKVHKACAALCIRGGIPPAFYAKDTSGRNLLMIMTDGGEAHGEALLQFVADPVHVTGKLRRWGDILLLDAPVSGIRRL